MTKIELANIIKILGIDLTEIEINLQLSNLFFHTIEWREEEDKIYLHYFKDEFDYEFDYDDFDEDSQSEIYKIIASILLN